MVTLSAIFCGKETTLIFLVIAFGALIGSAQREVPVEFQKCVTSCIDDMGYPLNPGNYPNCNQCNNFVQCNYGKMDIQPCPLGTNFFNRKLGVCDSDISVCVNDSLITTTTTSTTTPTTTTTTTSEATTSTSLTVGPVTTAPVVTTTFTTTTTVIPDLSTTTTPSTTTSTTTTTTTTSEASTSTTSTLGPVTTAPVVTSTFTTTTPVIQSTNSTGYIPPSGEESESFWFAIEFYNKNSMQATRAGVQTVDSFTAESRPDGTYYRIYGVALVQTSCPNKPEFTKADYTTCPLTLPATGTSNQYFVAKCDFKVRYTAPSNAAAKLDIAYMMCDK